VSASDESITPSPEDLERYAAGQTIDPAVRQCIEHDAEWRRRVERIRADNALLGEVLAANARDVTADGGDLDDDIPGYHINREISRGGQAIIYEAEQIATKRRVAVKMLLQGSFATSRQRARFEREVEIVAGLTHPNIVTVYESGVAGAGRHYLAMEYVNGVPLDQYLQQRASGHAVWREAVRARIQLVEKICDAVNYAHQRGVIHRDLKPGNILVDDNDEPHVLDFGVAKFLGGPEHAGRTQVTQGPAFLGTLAYAAPEQVREADAVDVRTDVYALGAVFYEMLTGRRPIDLDGSMTHVIEQIIEREPSRPSALEPAVDDELETIVMKALAKEPARRYQTAGELRADLAHYLAGEPINAKRDSRLYVLRKTAWRYRVPLGVAALFVIVVFGSLVVLLWQARRVNQENMKYRQAVTSLITGVESTQLDNAEGEISIAGLLDEAGRIIDQQLPDDPPVQAELLTKLGIANMDNARYDEAEQQLRRSVALRKTIHGEAHPAVAQSYHDLARVLWKDARYDEAASLYHEALEMRRATLGEKHEDVARTMHHLAACLRQRGKFEQAEQLYSEALAMRLELLPADHPDIANTRNSLALCLRDIGKLHEAEALYRDLLPHVAALFSEQDYRYASVLHNLGVCLLRQGELDEAQHALQRALAIKRQWWAEEAHPQIARTQTQLARLKMMRGELDVAEQMLNETIAIQRQAYADAHTDLATSLSVLGQVQLHKQRYDAAEDLLREALAIREEKLIAGHPLIAITHSYLGEALVDHGKDDAAERHLQSAYEQLTAYAQHDQRALKRTLRALIVLYERRGEAETAETYRRSLTSLQK